MTGRGLAAAVWLAFAFVAWNVIFDRLVWTSAVEFTREQISRHQAGSSLTNIHDGFSPRIGDAALEASLWTLPIIALGLVVIFYSFRRVR
jgi:hypothetical protein